MVKGWSDRGRVVTSDNSTLAEPRFQVSDPVSTARPEPCQPLPVDDLHPSNGLPARTRDPGGVGPVRGPRGPCSSRRPVCFDLADNPTSARSPEGDPGLGGELRLRVNRSVGPWIGKRDPSWTGRGRVRFAARSPEVTRPGNSGRVGSGSIAAGSIRSPCITPHSTYPGRKPEGGLGVKQYGPKKPVRPVLDPSWTSSALVGDPSSFLPPLGEDESG